MGCLASSTGETPGPGRGLVLWQPMVSQYYKADNNIQLGWRPASNWTWTNRRGRHSPAKCLSGPDGVVFPKADLRLSEQGVSKISTGQVHRGQTDPSQFQLGAFIGKGACGYVQKALYLPNNTLVALKTVNLFERDKRHQLMNDLKVFLSDQYQCDHLISFYGAFYQDGLIKIILEFMDLGSARDLASVLHSPFEEPFFAAFSRQVLLGLHYLHTKKHQLHRDIKPENILLNSQGRVKLSDFGISKELEKTKALTQTFVGTLSYMSPERIQGLEYGYSSDIWSLGLVLLELASGQFPIAAFRNEERLTYIERIQSMIQEEPPRLPPGLGYSALFASFIESMLVKDHTQRASTTQLLNHPWLTQSLYSETQLGQIMSALYSRHFHSSPSS